MKTLIITIILLFSSATMAQIIPKNVTLEQFPDFMSKNIQIGLEADITIYREYVDKTFYFGTPLENMKVAIRYAQCSITWRKAIELKIETDTIGKQILRNAIWRALASTRLHVLKAGGETELVNTRMVPVLFRDAELVMTASHIQTCAALDLVVFLDMKDQRIMPVPLDEWVIEPIPELDVEHDHEEHEESKVKKKFAS